jgi:hypothetical protein
MDTESFLFIVALCSLSVTAISFLQAPKVRSCSHILSPGEIPIINNCKPKLQRCHSRAGGNPAPSIWTGYRLKDCRNDSFKAYFLFNDETADLLRRTVR